MDHNKESGVENVAWDIIVTRETDPESYDLGLDISLIVIQFLVYGHHRKYLRNLDIQL